MPARARDASWRLRLPDLGAVRRARANLDMGALRGRNRAARRRPSAPGREAGRPHLHPARELSRDAARAFRLRLDRRHRGAGQSCAHRPGDGRSRGRVRRARRHHPAAPARWPRDLRRPVMDRRDGERRGRASRNARRCGRGLRGADGRARPCARARSGRARDDPLHHGHHVARQGRPVDACERAVGRAYGGHAAGRAHGRCLSRVPAALSRGRLLVVVPRRVLRRRARAAATALLGLALLGRGHRASRDALHRR